MKLLISGNVCLDNLKKQYIESLGIETTFVQDERIPLANQNINPAEFDMAVCNGLFLHNDISEFKNLKYIQLLSAGYDRVPLDYIKANNITIFNARDVYSIPMAEFALCGVLQLYKQSKFFNSNQEKHIWDKHRGLLELFGKNVLIVGCGSVGTECAKRFDAFGCNVYGIDLAPYENQYFKEIYSIDCIDEQLSNSDIVILTLPLTEQTKDLFNNKRFAKMKNGACLVNIARGPIVNQDDLINALKTKLFGAVIDVFNEEPLTESSQLWDLDNIIITPHNSFVGEGNNQRIFDCIIRNLENYLK